MNTRTIAPSAASVVIAAIFLAVTLAPAMASQPPDKDPCITNHAADQHVSNATGALKLAPLNPDFVAYQKSPLGTSDDHVCGYIPPPTDLSHLDDIPVERLQAPGALPSSFDWRDSGNVTPVKDQDPCGTCWTFGTTSVLESAVLINEGAEYNFSERSVALCVDRSWTYLYDGADDPCMAGGNSLIASEVFIRKGLVLESCNPYNTTALNCDGSCVCDDCAPVKMVDGYRLVTGNGSEIDAIKSAVYDHGPVTMSFYWHSSENYTNATWGAIYDCYPCTEPANHLVSIIGWNDSVPHPDLDHDGTGAWIVKNSWGTGWGDDGFFYLAYNSSCVQGVAYMGYKDPVPGEELLYWDEAGFVDSVGYGNSSWMASVFTANRSGNLTHVDFWTTSNNAEYEVHVREGYFGSELTNQTGICPEYGYYSIPLNTPISMDAGQQFTVEVNMTTPDYNFPIPIEVKDEGWVDPPIQSNVSFIRHNSSCPWTDMADLNQNACLRARMASKLPCTHGDICVNPTGWWGNNGTFNTSGTPIQSAVGNANAGETIYVWNGSYSENVDIGTASLTLQGEGADVVMVNAASASDHVFHVTANRVNISGFMVTGATGPDSAGINLCNADHCNISDNDVTNNDCGIYLTSSNNSTVTSNTLSDNNRDIYIKSTSSDFTNNTLSGTT
ncbi:MAG: C1 family peptidase, partial [Euryarchaeota archaeon]|nr:C1 family peptidase [Euryarchaeota archaeon]